MTNDLATAAAIGGITPLIEGNDHTSVAVYPVGARFADPVDWVEANKAELQADLRTRGAVLLRGFPVDVDVFSRVVALVGGTALEYTERSTPRTAVSGNVYTSTDYPAEQSIPMHNENSYKDSWPSLLFFFCHTASATGGATPVANSRAVLRLLPPDVRDRFAAGVTYTRTFREGLGLTWEETYQTTDRAAVEEYCARHGQEFEWTDEGLRTRHRRPAIAREPNTGEEVWFNQANLFHSASLGPELYEVLMSMYGEHGLPRHAFFGDGSAIGDEDLQAIAQAYETASVALPWQEGDILVINNMLTAHGRQPYTGERRILVAMT